MKDTADAILAADIHIRPDVPKCRLDDPDEAIAAMWHKWKQILTLSAANNLCPILISGDLGEKPEWPDFLLRQFITACKQCEHGPIIVIPGQHDLPAHNVANWVKSSIGILEADETIILLDGSANTPFKIGNLLIYDFPWEAPLSMDRFVGDRDPSGRYYKIAMSHQLIMEGKGNKADFPVANASFAINVLKANPEFDLILTGDNHKGFIVQHEGRWLVNPGSMLRSKSDQIHHKPSVYLWHAEDNKIKQQVLDHQGGVVSTEHTEDQKAKQDRMEAFIESIQEGGQQISLSFEDNLNEYLKENRVSDIIKKKTWECVA